MTDPTDRKTSTRPAGVRTYWMPGVEGIVLEASLADLIAHQGDARLVISKRSIAGKAHYTFELKKDKT